MLPVPLSRWSHHTSRPNQPWPNVGTDIFIPVTNLSVIDEGGTAVALTLSLGPLFGARVASPRHGLLFAHSYRMESAPEPGARDDTEMTPAVVLAEGRPVLAVGGAGSERIPGAVAQVIAAALDGDLGAAVGGRRLNWQRGRLQLSPALAPLAAALGRRGLPVAAPEPGHEAALGIVHAAGRAADGGLTAAADAAYDGEARVL